MPLWGEHSENEEAPEGILLFRNWLSRLRSVTSYKSALMLSLSFHFTVIILLLKL